MFRTDDSGDFYIGHVVSKAAVMNAAGLCVLILAAVVTTGEYSALTMKTMIIMWKQ